MTATFSLFKIFDFNVALLSVFLSNAVVFFLSQHFKDNTLVDIAWGPLHILPNLIILLMTNNWNARTIIAFSIVTFWGLRLAQHIGGRHEIGKEDFRYKEIRDNWMKKGKLFYYFMTFNFIFMGQACASLIVNGSCLYIVMFSKSGLTTCDYLGAIVAISGLAMEFFADS